jgi:hypothetical protein
VGGCGLIKRIDGQRKHHPARSALRNKAIERVVFKLFNRYNAKIKSIDSSISSESSQENVRLLLDKKLDAIAELYQLLEWLHPFTDGQGRTDLVLLSKLLVDEGFTPAILELPYMSTTSLPSDWVKYLQHGMERWKEEAKLSGV